MIDQIFVEELYRLQENENSLEKTRTAIYKVYNSVETYSGTDTANPVDVDYDNMIGTRSSPHTPVKPYIPTIEPTEDGYPGLMPPMN